MSEEVAALEAAGLGMRYGRRRKQVLDDCSFRVPEGSVCALVGPNGTGKSTLLKLAAGLLRPAAGAVRVLGGGPAEARERVAYVAQQKPLYPQLTVAETLRFGAETNPRRWDREAAERIAYAAGQDGGQKVRSLSGGQRTRVALALAVGKRPDLMLLDEPMADLDPLARHELAGALLAEATERGTTVVMSSHVIAELENSCDRLLLLGGGRVRLAGPVDELLAAHALLTGRGPDFGPHTVVEQRQSGRGAAALVRLERDAQRDSDWLVEQPTLDDLVLAHLRNPSAAPLVLGENGENGDRQQEAAA
ncbi:ABC transporter ATP-binding protein [Streptomyces sp. TR02-1]|uniref:ABC transporter ATP-binding protein n=1 Tax=Streptomyces sp. TR02-1 TaxID=3385977 RepID=UPI0039A28FDA